jgi:hypothetical protein
MKIGIIENKRDIVLNFAGGVGPSQLVEFMGEFPKKEALFSLRMAILASKLP